MASFGRSTVEERAVGFLANLWRISDTSKHLSASGGLLASSGNSNFMFEAEYESHQAWLVCTLSALTDVLVFLSSVTPSQTKPLRWSPMMRVSTS
jgi:hypothetical protein